MKRFLLVLLVVASAVCAHALPGNVEDMTPADRVITVTPSDSTEYLPPLKAVHVGTAGDVRVIAIGDKATYTCADAPVHLAHTGLIRVRTWKICATGTTATGILGYRKDP